MGEEVVRWQVKRQWGWKIRANVVFLRPAVSLPRMHVEEQKIVETGDGWSRQIRQHPTSTQCTLDLSTRSSQFEFQRRGNNNFKLASLQGTLIVEPLNLKTLKNLPPYRSLASHLPTQQASWRYLFLSLWQFCHCRIPLIVSTQCRQPNLVSAKLIFQWQLRITWKRYVRHKKGCLDERYLFSSSLIISNSLLF